MPNKKPDVPFEKNFDAKNKLYTGILGMIPAGLIGGPVGAIASLVAGIWGANKAHDKANNHEQWRAKYEFDYQTKKQYEISCAKRRELKEQGEKYACMSKWDTIYYLEDIRDEYPVTIHCYDGKTADFKPCCDIDCYGFKESEIEKKVYEKDFEEKTIRVKYSFTVKGKLPQDLVRELDQAKQRGNKIEILEVTIDKAHIRGYMSVSYTKENHYYYRVIKEDDTNEFHPWEYPDYRYER